MSAKQIENRIQVWSNLDGRRILLAGLDREQRQVYAQNLVHIASQKCVDLTVSEELDDVTEQDLVLVFAEIKEKPEKTGKIPEDGSETAALKKLMQDLRFLAEKKPEAVLLISDCKVYGKQFGVSGSRKEHELGYIAHTAETEIRMQYMRMTEHLACRLAKEEQLSIRIVRQNLRTETENLERMMDAVIQVLLCGQNGEIYNLISSGERPVLIQNDRSPLQPAEIVPDTEKLEHVLSGRR